MSKFLCIVFFIFLIIIVDCQEDKIFKNMKKKNPWHGLSMVCSMEDPKNVSMSCHGVRIIKRVIQQLLDTAVESPSIEITDGISLIKNNNYNPRNSRTIKDSIANFFEGVELKFKLQNLLPSNIDSSIVENISTGRGKGGGLGGGIPGLGGGKMLGMMSFGALGVVAMKALGVSLLALVLSLVVAAKKYSTGSPKSEASEHHVVYAQDVPNPPERRSASAGNAMAYNGHAQTYGNQERFQNLNNQAE